MRRMLQDAIAARAAARPDATAVVSSRECLRYDQLEEASNRLGQLLVDGGCGRGERVALLVPKGSAAILGMLGTLKAGAAYVPLNPGDPPARLARTLGSADCRWVLIAGDAGSALHQLIATEQLPRPPLVGRLDEHTPRAAPPAVFAGGDLEAFPATPPAIRRADGDLAQILFTSGSTGTPKGVMITHATILSFIDWATGYFGIDADDRISQHAPLRFDLSTFDVFGALSAGAELHLVPPELNLLPHKLAAFIRDRGLTQWLSVPAVLNLMAKFDVVRADDFPRLRRVLFAGEVLPTPTLIHWMRRLRHVRFTNLYGPTETTIASSYYTIPAEPEDPREPIPIGRPCAGEELLVLDDALRPVAAGEVGELCIRGAGVTAGYWRDDERTARAFIECPAGAGPRDRLYRTGDRARLGADGLLYFCGRADMQVKSRGYRIELGEVEAALHLLPHLRESAVVAIESDGFEGALICCAYAPAPDTELPPSQLRGQLAELLPGFMLPMRWLRYEALPKNATGKVDRAGLVEAFRKAEQLQDQPAA